MILWFWIFGAFFEGFTGCLDRFASQIVFRNKKNFLFLKKKILRWLSYPLAQYGHVHISKHVLLYFWFFLSQNVYFLMLNNNPYSTRNPRHSKCSKTAFFKKVIKSWLSWLFFFSSSVSSHENHDFMTFMTFCQFNLQISGF